MVQLVMIRHAGDGLSPPVYMHRVMWRRQQRRRFGHTARAATHGGRAGGGEGYIGLGRRSKGSSAFHSNLSHVGQWRFR